MPGYSRRQLLGVGAAGAGTVLAGGYGWNQYATRHHLRFRPLEAVNETADPLTLEFAVEGNGIEAQRTVRLAPAGEEGATHLPGRWIKSAAEWTVSAEYEGETLEIRASEITERLEGAGWGPDCARVALVVTATGELEARVGPC
ncbi:hypothetical protein [Natronococcus sp. A-GB7]|uniref:hypothetical protein n=1 Tax=Natronococcus sp. A-GB7 TaxID=3037649 RepID=UPI00241EDCC2|nr:hypothetical protein [Natronococcus sp. A-GB7]MDG5817272.1 hypothetical protein [Natronococcus sp. A-GB7]